MPIRAGVSIVCLTGQRCLLCASWNIGYLICASHACCCLFDASWDTRYLICPSHGSGCLFCAQQGRGIYCVHHRTGVSILCLLGHRVSDMCLTWQWMFILCSTGRGYLLCDSQDSGLFCGSRDKWYITCASHGSGCLFCAQQGRGVYCVPYSTGLSILRFLGHRVCNMCLTWQRVFIVCIT